MWELLLGTAAANKAISVGVGLSVLLGAAGTAEVTGVGPAVREMVRPVTVDTEETDTNEDSEIVAEIEELKVDDIEADDLEVQESNTEEETDNVDHPKNDREQFVVHAENAPGNLVWHLRSGAFNLRGFLVEDGDRLAIRTAGPDGSTVDLPVDAEVVATGIPGAKSNKPQDDSAADSESTIDDYIGYLVRASGKCAASETDGEEVETECTVTSLRILGKAGQSDDADGAEAEDSEARSDDDESDEDESEEDDADDKSHGKPEHAGGQKPNKPSDD